MATRKRNSKLTEAAEVNKVETVEPAPEEVKVKEEKPKRTRKTSTTKKSVKNKQTEDNNSNESKPLDKMVVAGDRDCYCYFSMKVTNEHRSADIISIGMVSPNGDTFYAENIGIDFNKVSNVKNDVIIHCLKKPETHLDGHTWLISGPLVEIRKAMFLWLDEHFTNKNKLVQFCTDKNIYEFGFLKELLAEGKTFSEVNLAYSEYCIDLNEQLSMMFAASPSDRVKPNFIPMYEVTYIDRVATYNNILKDIGDIKNDPSLIQIMNWGKGKNTEGDALFSAIMTRVIHQEIWALRDT